MEFWLRGSDRSETCKIPDLEGIRTYDPHIQVSDTLINLLHTHCSCDLIAERLDEIGQRGAIAGLDEGLDRHAGEQSKITQT